MTPDPWGDPQIWERALAALEEALQSPVPLDRGWSVPIVGEFSSGKTRLVRELLQDHLPEGLHPLCSLEPQTCLPLEVTYGPEVGLWQVRLTADDERAIVQRWERFPSREELLALQPRADLASQRLQLTLPLDSLVLPRDPGDPSSAATLRLIDTPGWNDREPVVEIPPLMGLVGLIYVVQATRLDGKSNQEELRAIAQGLAGCLNCPDKMVVMAIVTSWHDDAEGASLKGRFEERLRDILQEEISLPIQLAVRCVDFATMTPQSRQAFAQWFWEQFHGGCEPDVPSEEVSFHGVDPGLFQEKLQRLMREVSRAQDVLEQVRSRLEAKEGPFPGWNRVRLEAYSPSQRRSKLMQPWDELFAQARPLSPLLSQPLAEPPPLGPWWNDILLPLAEAGIASVVDLVQAIHGAVEKIATTPKKDIQRQGRLALEGPLARSQRAMLWSGALFPPSLRRAIEGRASLESLIATLMAITAAQAALAPFLASKE